MTDETIAFNYEFRPVEKGICDASILEVILYNLDRFYKNLIVHQE